MSEVEWPVACGRWNHKHSMPAQQLDLDHWPPKKPTEQPRERCEIALRLSSVCTRLCALAEGYVHGTREEEGAPLLPLCQWSGRVWTREALLRSAACVCMCTLGACTTAGTRATHAQRAPGRFSTRADRASPGASCKPRTSTCARESLGAAPSCARPRRR